MTDHEYEDWQDVYYRLRDAWQRRDMLNAALAEDAPHRADHELRLALWNNRYGAVASRTKVPADATIRVWLELVHTAQHSTPFFSKKRLANELHRHLEQLGCLIVECGGEAAHMLLYNELLNGMRIYLDTCTKDGKYGSQLFGMMAMEKVQLQLKIAREICHATILLPARADCRAEFAVLTAAAQTAFEEAFPGCGAVLQAEIAEVSAE